MKLPGDFQAGRNYLMSGETLIAWRDALLADRIIAGTGLKEMSAGKLGRILTAEPGTGVAAAAPTGAFYGLYVADGHTYLQGGSITGGHGGSETIADIKVLDATTGVGTNAGKILYLKASCTAVIFEGIMLPGVELNSATTGIATDLPENHAFTVAAPTGDLHLEIGRWTADAFLPAQAGNATVGGCIGNFTIGRA